MNGSTRGLLLLAEAQLAQNHFAETEAALKEISAELTPELDWRRRHLLCRAKLGAGRTEEAEIESAGLLTAAAGTARGDWLAESVAFRAALLERLGRRDEAMATLKRNLNTNTPVPRQREALSQIAALALAQGQFKVATETLETFVQQFSNSPAADLCAADAGRIVPEAIHRSAGYQSARRRTWLLSTADHGVYQQPVRRPGAIKSGLVLWIEGRYRKARRLSKRRRRDCRPRKTRRWRASNWRMRCSCKTISAGR